MNTIQQIPIHHIAVSLEEYYKGCRKEIPLPNLKKKDGIMINQSMKEHQIYVNDYAGKEGIIQYQFYFVINPDKRYKRINKRDLSCSIEITHQHISKQSISFTFINGQTLSINIFELKSHTYEMKDLGLKAFDPKQSNGKLIINFIIPNDVRKRMLYHFHQKNLDTTWLETDDITLENHSITEESEKKRIRYDLLKEKEDILMRKEEYLQSFIDSSDN